MDSHQEARLGIIWRELGQPDGPDTPGYLEVMVTRPPVTRDDIAMLRAHAAEVRRKRRSVERPVTPWSEDLAGRLEPLAK